MKKLVVVMALLAFVAAAPVAMGADKAAKDVKVACCHDGKCDKHHTKAECEKERGKVVKDCSECK